MSNSEPTSQRKINNLERPEKDLDQILQRIAKKVFKSDSNDNTLRKCPIGLTMVKPKPTLLECIEREIDKRCSQRRTSEPRTNVFRGRTSLPKRSRQDYECTDSDVDEIVDYKPSEIIDVCESEGHDSCENAVSISEKRPSINWYGIGSDTSTDSDEDNANCNDNADKLQSSDLSIVDDAFKNLGETLKKLNQKNKSAKDDDDANLLRQLIPKKKLKCLKKRLKKDIKSLKSFKRKLKIAIAM